MATGVGSYYFIGAGGGSGGSFTTPWLGANGTAAAPTYSFTSSTSTGMYSPGTNQLGLSTNGVAALTIDASQNTTLAANLNLALAAPINWTTGGSLLHPSDGVYNLTNNAGTNAVSLQIGTGTTDNSAGNLGITFGTRGNSLALNLSKFGAGATLGVQSGAGSWAPIVASGYGLNGSSANTLGVSFSSTQVQINGTTISFIANGTAAGTVSSTQQWSGIKPATATKTTAYTVVAADSFTVFDNTAAGSQVVYTLPAAAVGRTYTFINTAAGATFTKVLAVGTDTIAQNGTLGSAAGNLVSTAIWTSVKIVCSTAGVWAVTSATGTWTLT